mgnify:CR=1 FL=1
MLNKIHWDIRNCMWNDPLVYEVISSVMLTLESLNTVPVKKDKIETENSYKEYMENCTAIFKVSGDVLEDLG